MKKMKKTMIAALSIATFFTTAIPSMAISADDVNISEVTNEMVSADDLGNINYAIGLDNYLFTYDGTEKRPNAIMNEIVIDENTGENIRVPIDPSWYTVSYENNINAGNGCSCIVKGVGLFSETINSVVHFSIAPARITPTITVSNQTYTGSAIKPTITVKNGSTILKSTDYDVEYTNNTNVGTATVNVNLKGNYIGTASRTFKINSKAISSSNVTISDSNAAYTGNSKTVGMTVKVGTKTLVQNTDYTVSYTNNRNIGQATVTIKGIGNYSGTVTKTFNIIPQTVTVKSDYSCTTNSIRINWNKVSNATGYRIYRFNGTNWRSVATVRGADTTTYKDHNYSGTLYQYKVKAYTKVDGVNYWGNASAEKYASTKSRAVKITSASTTSSAIRLNWSKQDGNGYQIYQLISGKYVKIATVKNMNTTTYRVENLNADTKYSFKVRAYCTDTTGRVNAGVCGSKSVTTDDITNAERAAIWGEKMANEVLDLINKERTSRGLNPVTTDTIITSVAQLRSKQLRINFNHDLDGVDAGDLLRNENYAKNGWGENIAWNQRNAKEVMEDWMNSTDGHRENILDPDWTKAGVGCYIVTNPYQSNSDNSILSGTIYWVQVFAS